jgi:hypothetical protein
MPKSKKTLLSKSSITKQEQKSKKKEKFETFTSKQPIELTSGPNNNILQTNEQTNEFISLTTENNVIVKDFLIIAGSYERILYGIDAHWIKSGKEGSDNVYVFKYFNLTLFESI